MPALNAAFINVGYKKDAFLHYHDLGPKFSTLKSFVKDIHSEKIKNFSLTNYKFSDDINKDGSISDVINTNEPILIQIVKEPISTKGPRVTSEISFAGRFLVLVPFSSRISISQKIEDSKEKDRLKFYSYQKDEAFKIILQNPIISMKVILKKNSAFYNCQIMILEIQAYVL